jgi:metallophosphoesterase (TIGR00282 family)
LTTTVHEAEIPSLALSGSPSPALPVRVIMLGDVVGEPGLTALERVLPGLIREEAADFVLVNGENAAEGFGLTRESLERILAAGADVVRSGNHVWEKRDFWPVLDSNPRVLRPANYPEGTVGRGWVSLKKPCPGGELSFVALNLQGRELMTPINCPFKTFDALAAAWTDSGDFAGAKPLILVDFHAESTREKEALACYLDGRVSLVGGTHTHVQTADERVLPGGAAYITDLGMTGVTGSVIGMDPKICLDRARTHILYRMACAQGASSVQGVVAEIDGPSRRAVSIKRINIPGEPATGLPG